MDIPHIHSSVLFPLLPLSLPFVVYPPNFLLHQQDFGNLLLEKSSPRQLVNFSLAVILPMTSCLECKLGSLRLERRVESSSNSCSLLKGGKGLLNLCKSPPTLPVSCYVSKAQVTTLCCYHFLWGLLGDSVLKPLWTFLYSPDKTQIIKCMLLSLLSIYVAVAKNSELISPKIPLLTKKN